jgi:hypothetical protein
MPLSRSLAETFAPPPPPPLPAARTNFPITEYLDLLGAAGGAAPDLTEAGAVAVPDSAAEGACGALVLTPEQIAAAAAAAAAALGVDAPVGGAGALEEQAPAVAGGGDAAEGEQPAGGSGAGMPALGGFDLAGGGAVAAGAAGGSSGEPSMGQLMDEITAGAGEQLRRQQLLMGAAGDAGLHAFAGAHDLAGAADMMGHGLAGGYGADGHLAADHAVAAAMAAAAAVAGGAGGYGGPLDGFGAPGAGADAYAAAAAAAAGLNAAALEMNGYAGVAAGLDAYGGLGGLLPPGGLDMGMPDAAAAAAAAVAAAAAAPPPPPPAPPAPRGGSHGGGLRTKAPRGSGGDSGEAHSFRGVFWDKKSRRWRCQLGHKNKKIFLGYFNDAAEAARAYDAKLVELNGANGVGAV